MLRGWGEGSKNPFDGNDDAESPPPPPPPPMQQDEAANGGTSSYDPPQITVDAPAQHEQMYREWDRATQRYQQMSSNEDNNNDESSIIEEDPLASPGNSSVNSGYGGGWSLGAGMVERTSICHPFDDEEDDDDDDDDNKSTRSSSPRESQFKTHGLSMVKEDDGKDDAKAKDKNNSSGVNGNVGKVSTMFDDVDLEAFPQNLPTGSSTNGSVSPKSPKDKYSNGDTNDSAGVGGWYKGNITKRILHEIRTVNPQTKYKALLGFSIFLVSSCLIAIAVSASKNNERNGQLKKQQEEPVDLTELLSDLESETSYTGIPSFIPTKFPTESPSVKPTTKMPTMKPTNEQTYDPTVYPTMNTIR